MTNCAYTGGGMVAQGPVASLVMDVGGNLCGTVAITGENAGGVFKVTPEWQIMGLYGFRGGADGGFPTCSVILDASGNIYGTAPQDGANGRGVIWEITSRS
jgi:hypothetical protein